MATLDIAIIAIFVISIIIGLIRGFIKESLSIVTWVAAIWLAITFNVEVGAWISSFYEIPNATFRDWAGFVLVFIVALFVLALISHLLVKLLSRESIGGVDRTLGLIFGALRAALIVVLLLMVMSGFGFLKDEGWQESRFAGYFQPFVETIEEIVFGDSQQQVEETSR